MAGGEFEARDSLALPLGVDVRSSSRLRLLWMRGRSASRLRKVSRRRRVDFREVSSTDITDAESS